MIETAAEIPLSVGQRALRFLETSACRDPSIIARALWLPQFADQPRLEAGFQALIDHHPALRCRLGEKGLRCEGAPAFALVEHEAAHLDDRQLRRRLQSEARRPFDLTRDLPIRVSWWPRTRGGVLLIVLHHMSTDLWSLGVLADELGRWLRADDAPGDGAPADREEDWIFAEHATGQEEALESLRARRGLEHFRAHLAGASPAPLPVDQPPPTQRTHRAHVERLDLSFGAPETATEGDLTEALDRLAQNRSASPATVLFALYGAFLARWSGGNDVIVGLLVPGRPPRTPKTAAGYFMNVLPIRFRFAGAPTVNDAVDQAKRALRGALRYQTLPFSTVVEHLNPRGGRGTAPIFQALFSFQAAPVSAPGLVSLVLERPGEPVHFGPLAGEVFPVDLTSSPYDLALLAGRVGDRICGRLEVAEEVFHKATAQRLAHRLLTFIQAAVLRPACPVAELPLLPEAERRWLLTAGQGSVRHEEQPLPVHQAVWWQAAHAPSSVAVRGHTWRQTFGEVKAQATRLAAALQQHGIGSEERVAVALERGPELLPALLAVLATGAVFVPLAPALPDIRRARILKTAGTRRVLTDRPQAAKWPAGTEVLTLEALQHSDAEGTVTTVMPPERLAYTQLTSGSTGEPKGVEISHGALSNLLGHFARTLRLGPESRVLALAPLTFDISLLELFAPLVVGGEVLMATDDDRLDGRRLRRLIEEEAPTHLQATPVVWRHLLDARWTDGRGRIALCGGEALPPDLARRLLATGLDLRNVYGPTETTIWSSEGRIEASTPISLGEPITATRLHVLDRHGRLVPAGVSGELCIAGRGLARGYAGQPALTARSFVPDAHGGAGDRLYRTGDLVRRRSDGALEFLGRTDRQIKLRGVRLEPGEIEAALRELPQIGNAVVQALTSDTDIPELVAWVTPAGDAESDSVPPEAELRAHLGAVLPRDRIPTRYVTLTHLPLSASGKIDIARLPPPPKIEVEPAAPPSASLPRDPVTERLAGLWSELLGRPPAGLEADFFAAGGHSLRAARLLGRIQRDFGVDVPIRILLEDATFGALLEAVRGAEPIEAMPRVEAGQLERGLPLSLGQEQLWLAQQFYPRSAAFHMAAAFRLLGPLQISLLHQALAWVADRHPLLRVAFEEIDGEPLMRSAAAPRLAVIDAQRLGERQRSSCLGALTEAPFDLSASPWRTAVVIQGPEEHLLVFTQHHLISDGRSVEMLSRELGTVYKALTEGSEPNLPPLLGTYFDFVATQRRRLASANGRGELDAEAQRLRGLQMTDWAPDRPRPTTRRWLGKRLSIELSRDESDTLRHLASAHRATVFMAVLAAFAIALRERTGHERVVIGTDGANRGREEEQGILGFFVNQLVLDCDLTNRESFIQALEASRRAVIEAFEHEDLPFEALVARLRPRHDPSRAPLFQIKIVAFDPPRRLGLGRELDVQPAPLGLVPTKFDLTLFVSTREPQVQISVEYLEDLYEDATLQCLVDDLRRILTRAILDPHRSIRSQTKRSPTTMSPKFKRVALRSVDASAMSAVETSFLEEGLESPLVITPHMDLDLAEWAQANSKIDGLLVKHGSILFRGFHVPTAAAFAEASRGLIGDLYADNGELPRESLDADDVYTSTPYPEDRMISWHNENSFLHRWPGKIAFCCLVAAREGGETPLCDSREVLKRIPEEVRRRFAEHGIQYLRNFRRGLGLDWTAAFRTDDRAEVESRCHRDGIQFEWLSEDHLRLRWNRPAIVRHHQTGEALWFNQVTHFHPAMLGPEAVAAFEESFDQDDLPRNCFYGDGGTIADDEVEAICDAYRACQVVFPWRQGDIVLIDNMLMAHARNPYRGERRLAVAIGGILDDSRLPA